MTPITFFTKYSTLGATSRYRSVAFFSKLATLDYNLELQQFLDTDYLVRRFAGHSLKKRHLFYAYILRYFSLLRAAPNLIIERELLPYLPYQIERFLIGNRRYILDFDDNVWEDYKGKWLLEGKYDALVHGASGVIVGNRFLEEYVSRLNPNVLYLPTVVDLSLYRKTKPKKFDRFTLVWIGSSVTYRYIESSAKLFVEMAKVIDFDLLIIASKSLQSRSISGVSMRFFDWSSETETELLRRAHVGIMPLSDDPFSQGKSGLKLIQYLAAELPVIASPVGENQKIVIHQKNGYLAQTPQEWIKATHTLMTDPVHYRALSESASQSAHDYSIDTHFIRYRSFIDHCFGITPKPATIPLPISHEDAPL